MEVLATARRKGHVLRPRASFVEQKPEIVRALVAAGHVIGNHSWDHPRLIFASDAELRSQVEQTQAAVFDACGVTPTLFRPPYGGRRPGTLQAVRASLALSR